MAELSGKAELKTKLPVNFYLRCKQAVSPANSARFSADQTCGEVKLRAIMVKVTMYKTDGAISCNKQEESPEVITRFARGF